MAEMNNKQRKETAKDLYLKSDMTQKEIAEIVGVTEKTLSVWINANDGEWKLLKASYTITRGQELRRILMQICDINTLIESRKVGERHATPKEADTLSKLSAIAKSLDTKTSISDTISVFVGFTDFLKEINLEKAKEFMPFLNAYIQHKSSEI